MINALKKIAHKKNEKMRYKLHAQSCPMKTFIKFRKKGREEVENIGKGERKKQKCLHIYFATIMILSRFESSK